MTCGRQVVQHGLGRPVGPRAPQRPPAAGRRPAVGVRTRARARTQCHALAHSACERGVGIVCRHTIPTQASSATYNPHALSVVCRKGRARAMVCLRCRSCHDLKFFGMYILGEREEHVINCPRWRSGARLHKRVAQPESRPASISKSRQTTSGSQGCGSGRRRGGQVGEAGAAAAATRVAGHLPLRVDQAGPLTGTRTPHGTSVAAARESGERGGGGGGGERLTSAVLPSCRLEPWPGQCLPSLRRALHRARSPCGRRPIVVGRWADFTSSARAITLYQRSTDYRCYQPGYGCPTLGGQPPFVSLRQFCWA